MLENILTLKKYSHKTKLTVKSIVAVSLVALAVVLPQIVHLAAGQAGGVTWLPMYLPVLLAGCLLGASFLYTRNLCFPVVLHWFWNWLQGPVLGYEVSGMDSGETLLTLRLTGSDLLTGGSFGFEGSLLCTVLLVVGTLAIVAYYERRGRKEA